MNKRKFPRAEFKCSIRILKNGQEELLKTHTENVGAGGICVVLEKDLGLFEDVSLEIFLDKKEKPVSCGGTVIWVVKRHPTNESGITQYDTGIEFKAISEEGKRRVSWFVLDLMKGRT